MQAIEEIILGNSLAIKEMKKLIEMVCASATTVLIQGETGTGKDIVAQAIHKCSGKKGAFITVNGSEVLGDKFDKIRVLIEDPTKDLEYVTPAIYAEQAKIDNTPKEEESEADAIERIKERFDILDRMTHAVAEGTVRGMIVSGPPGVGKSFGV